MKKYIYLLTFCYFLMSCASEEKLTEAFCPEIFISKEHKEYYSSADQNYDDVNFSSSINNFNSKCKSNNEGSILSILDILFVVKPLKQDVREYSFYYFVSILDDNDNVLDYQIFEKNGRFMIGDGQIPQETEVVDSLDQFLPTSENNFYKIGIGFVLNENLYNYINN